MYIYEPEINVQYKVAALLVQMLGKQNAFKTAKFQYDGRTTNP